MLQPLSFATRSRLRSAIKSNNLLTAPFTRRLTTFRPQPTRPTIPRLTQRIRFTRRHKSTQQTHPTEPPTPKRPLSTSEKLKDLSRRYGYAALGVYLGLSALDFPFCFLAVRMLGPERVGEAEHYIVDGFWRIVGGVVPSMKPAPSSEIIQGEGKGGEMEVAASKEKEGASLWTQLLIAYGVHKSLIFFRVPITAAITPNIVKYLRKRGWNIGRPKPT